MKTLSFAVTTLCGLCGLKSINPSSVFRLVSHNPLRVVWIEMHQFLHYARRLCVTTLCGLCGLKLVNPPADIVIHCHNPLRVVWIEIALQQSEGIRGKSQPFAGCVD